MGFLFPAQLAISFLIFKTSLITKFSSFDCKTELLVSPISRLSSGVRPGCTPHDCGSHFLHYCIPYLVNTHPANFSTALLLASLPWLSVPSPVDWRPYIGKWAIRRWDPSSQGPWFFPKVLWPSQAGSPPSSALARRQQNWRCRVSSIQGRLANSRW